MGGRVDQHGTIIDDGIAISGYAIFARHFVISNAARRKIRTDADYAFVAIRRNRALRT
jgi:hypothetical protein